MPNSALAAVLLAAGWAALWTVRRSLTGTTLVAVWWWCLAALVALGGSELAIALAAGEPTPGWVAPLRLMAATGTLTPIIGLFGAKRPQDRGWQFIVLALWAILSLPSLKWLLFGGEQEMHAAQLAFLGVLIGAGAVNGLVTRRWLSSLLYCGGQLALFAPYFPPTRELLAPGAAATFGMALVVLAWWLWAADLPRGRVATDPLSRVWLDFRDDFGAVWGLRVMERMNASSTMYGWPLVLSWSGFVPRDDVADVFEAPPALEDSLRTLLRRFVSREWIDERMASQRALADRRASSA
jgi:hypothetical protein